MKIRRFALITLAFALIISSTAVFAQADTSIISKIKRFFKGSSEPVAVQETIQKEVPLVATVDAPFQAQEKPVVVDRFAPTFDFSERTLGNADAPVKMMLFTSLTCGHCATLHKSLLPQIIEKYVDTGVLQVTLADFPLDERATIGSMISKCLTGQRYFAFMDTLYAYQNKWMMTNNLTQSLAPYAKLAGMPEQKMLACAQDPTALKEITRQRNLYSMKYKISATPTMVLTSAEKTKQLQGVPTIEAFAGTIEQLTGDKPFTPDPEVADPHAGHNHP